MPCNSKTLPIDKFTPPLAGHCVRVLPTQGNSLLKKLPILDTGLLIDFLLGKSNGCLTVGSPRKFQSIFYVGHRQNP